jgi:hypothetical protein
MAGAADRMNSVHATNPEIGVLRLVQLADAR